MGEVLKIFISATSADLGAARTVAKHALLTRGYFPEEQAHFGPVPETILEMLRRKIGESDAVLHIVGECHGAEPPGEPPRSYTQWEYHLARELGKPIYLFVCAKGFPYAKHQREAREKQALQRAHREAVIAPGGNKYELIPDLATLEARVLAIELPRRHDELGLQLQKYYTALREQFANYDNVGLPVIERDGKEEKKEPIKIRDLFVPPHCSDQHIKPAELDAAVRKGETLGQPLLPLLEKPAARLVLLADPGMGKSTVIQLLIATLADNDAPADAPGLRGAIPFPFILRELVRLLPADVQQWNWNALLDAFRRWDPRGTGEAPLAKPIDDPALLRTLTGREDAFFLIDGLDEIGDPASREALRDALWEGFERFPQARWLITSRIVGYERAKVDKMPSDWELGEERFFLSEQALTSASTRRAELDAFADRKLKDARVIAWWRLADLLYLAPFNDAQQRAFAGHWYGPRMSGPKGAQRAREFIDAVHQNSHTRVIGRIPNLLYLMALLYRHEAQLPHGRTLVYEKISEAYLERIPLQRKLLGESGAFAELRFPEKEQLLAIVGMKMQQMRASRSEGEDGDILVSRAQLAEWLGPHFASAAELDVFLQHVARHSGLLLPRGEGVYGFAHLSFQEYYAACHLEEDFSRILTEGDESGHEQRVFAEYATQPVWHEPLLFLVEGFRGNKNYTKKVLRWMFPQLADDPAKGRDWMPFPAAQLLATLSVDPEVALDPDQRSSYWQKLWAAHCVADTAQWHIAPWLLVAGSALQLGVLQAAAVLQPQRLNLSGCTGLGDLTPLAGLSGLQSLFLLGCTGLGDLAPLAGLTGLQMLDLDRCTGLGDLTPLAGLTGLQRLDLSGCTGLGDFTPLAGLSGLQTLWLNGCTGLGDLTPLAGLAGLRTLVLRSCTGLGDLTPLAGLTGLQQLDFSGCTALGDLTPLAGLSRLQSLDLSGCTGLGDLTPLAGLTSLTWLNLGGCTGLGDLTPLAGLTGLKRLYLHDCSGLSGEEIEKVQKALPKAEITR